MSTDPEALEARLALAEARLRRVEDHLEILNLLNAYGPLADSGMAEAAAALWEPGGGYSFSDPATGAHHRVSAPDEIAGMLGSQANLDMINEGSGHLAATPHIAINGDVAEAIGYTMVVRREGERWFVFRAAINHWRLHRSTKGWRVIERINRTLNGSEQSLELMRGILPD